MRIKFPVVQFSLFSDMPLMPEGVKTQEMDKKVTAKYVDMHLEMGSRP
ncbi:MAG: hypothetical protein Ct9H300mP21_03440 [Pseudomonadota bacterium]|nr:MAG: hypothetical protein Ct9H300mP21_03440 [Pseudomonadota bacterium]